MSSNLAYRFPQVNKREVGQLLTLVANLGRALGRCDKARLEALGGSVASLEQVSASCMRRAVLSMICCSSIALLTWLLGEISAIP